MSIVDGAFNGHIIVTLGRSNMNRTIFKFKTQQYSLANCDEILEVAFEVLKRHLSYVAILTLQLWRSINVAQPGQPCIS